MYNTVHSKCGLLWACFGIWKGKGENPLTSVVERASVIWMSSIRLSQVQRNVLSVGKVVLEKEKSSAWTNNMPPFRNSYYHWNEGPPICFPYIFTSIMRHHANIRPKRLWPVITRLGNKSVTFLNFLIIQFILVLGEICSLAFQKIDQL